MALEAVVMMMSSDRIYGDTIFKVSGHSVRHLAEIALRNGQTMQEVLDRCLAVLNAQWCNDCWHTIHDTKVTNDVSKL